MNENTWNNTGPRSYVRRDGISTTLDVWVRPCAACGERFEVMVPANTEFGNSKSFSLVHCKTHRGQRTDAQQKATLRWGAAMTKCRAAKQRAAGYGTPLRITGQTAEGEPFCGGLVHGRSQEPVLPDGMYRWSLDGIERYAKRRGWHVERMAIPMLPAEGESA